MCECVSDRRYLTAYSCTAHTDTHTGSILYLHFSLSNLYTPPILIFKLKLNPVIIVLYLIRPGLNTIIAPQDTSHSSTVSHSDRWDNKYNTQDHFESNFLCAKSLKNQHPQFWYPTSSYTATAGSKCFGDLISRCLLVSGYIVIQSVKYSLRTFLWHLTFNYETTVTSCVFSILCRVSIL